MYGLLRPTTLAAIIADLQAAEDNAWIGNDNELLALDDATAHLASLVGPASADRLITEARAAYHPTNRSRKLCYRHHCLEFDKLPNALRGEPSAWITVDADRCELCQKEAV